MKTNSKLLPILLTILAAGRLGAQNVVTNGDFEAGNVAFTTEYTYSPDDLFPARTLAVLTNPNSAHGSFAVMGDHTSGTGKMLVVNGATEIPHPVVWSQQVAVKPNREYYFSAWAANVLGGFSSRFVFRINGTALQPEVTLPGAVALWQNYTTIWTSGAATKATLEIVFVSSEQFGNDTALDDIVFRPTASGIATAEPSLSPAVWVEWDTVTGVDYQLQSSTDMQAWINVGTTIPGTGAPLNHCEKRDQQRRFFRVIGLER
jgi:hypothetical protein